MNTTNGKPLITPHEVNQRVADWSIKLSSARSDAECQEFAEQLLNEHEDVQARVKPLLKARLAELNQPTPENYIKDQIVQKAINQLEWVAKAVRLVLEASECIRKHEPGATGLVPLGFMRDGGEVLLNHRVVIRDQFKGNRAAIFAQSGKGKTNLMKIVLFWVLFNSGYGKLIFDYKGEYVPWTQNERGEDVPGLCEHPLAMERVVLYTTKERHLLDDDLNAKVTVRPLKIHLRSILPRDFALFWPNLTKPQQEFLYTYVEESWVYDVILGEEKGWGKLGAWFGDAAAKSAEEGDEDGGSLEASAKRVVRNIRKKLQAAQKRSYIVDSPARIEESSDGRLVLHTPFKQKFVDELKQKIPSGQRSWDKEAKVWMVNSVHRNTAEELIRRFYGVDAETDSLGLIGQDLAAGKLVVIDFSGIASESDRDLIATLITRRQFEYNLERIDLDEGPEGRIPFVVFFEEAQNLLGAQKVRESRNSIFIRTFKEGRALSIGTTSITQQPGALSQDLTSQIAYYIVQHLRSHSDIRDLVAIEPALEGAESDIGRRIPGNALYVDNDRGFPLPIKIDKFDQAFVEAVRHAYDAVNAELLAENE